MPLPEFGFDEDTFHALAQGYAKCVKPSQDGHLGATANEPSSFETIALGDDPSERLPTVANDFTLKIYDNDEVRCRNFNEVTESLPTRTASVDEQDGWNEMVGGAWNVPEDGRFKLTFSRRSLLSVDSITATQHLQDLRRDDDEIAKWCNVRGNGRTSVVDVFDDGKMRVYGFDPVTAENVNVGSVERKKIDYRDIGRICKGFHGEVVLDAGPSMAWDGPWRRIISIWAPETRSRCLIHLTGSNTHPESQRIPRPRLGIGADDIRKLDLTFYEIVSVPAERAANIPWKFWKSGELYGNDSKSEVLNNAAFSKPRPTVRKLVQSRYHLQTFAYRSPTYHSKYWTLLEFNPATFDTKQSTQQLQVRSRNMLVCFFGYAYTGIAEIVSRYRRILEFFDELIDEGPAFLDPAYHNHYKILSDNEITEKSKKYFWAISSLQELHTSICINISEIERMLRKKIAECPEKEEWEGVQMFRGLVVGELGRLKEVAGKMEVKRTEVVVLRDRLVGERLLMDQGNSVRLYRNVMFLISVNIFLLALLFCWVVYMEYHNDFAFRRIIVNVASVLATAIL